jgi:hypothetical protein
MHIMEMYYSLIDYCCFTNYLVKHDVINVQNKWYFLYHVIESFTI